MSDRTSSYASQQSAQKDDIAVIVNTIDNQQQKYAGILPSNVKWGDFRNAFLVAVQMNPRLLEADRQSLWLALQKAASAGLKPDGQESALVIFGDDTENEDGKVVASTAKGKKKVQFLPMVWGLTKQMRNTGNIASVRAKVIYKGERVVVTDENGQETYKHERVIEHGSSIDETDENIVGAYAVVAYKDGFWDAEFMSLRQLMRVKAVSKAKNGPWKTFFPQQCMKTPLKRLSLRVEKSAVNERYFQAIADDETIGPVIDGDKPTDMMGEFSTDKQAASTQQTNGRQQERAPDDDDQVKGDALKAEHAALQAAAAEKRKPTVETVKVDVKAEAEPKHPDDTAHQGFDHFALDEITGEPVEDKNGNPVNFRNPGSFALWYVERYRASADKTSLEEFNADALDEVRQHKAAGLILATLVSVVQEPEGPASVKEKEASKPAAIDSAVVPMSVLPNRKMNLTKYCLAVGEALKKIKTDADLAAWISSNAQVMAEVPLGGAYGMKLDGLIKARVEQLRIEAAPKPLIVDMDEQRAMDLKAELDAATTEQKYDEIIRRETTKVLARRLTQERPELRKIIAEADTAAFKRVKPSVAPKEQFNEPPPDDNVREFDDEIPWNRYDGPPPQEREGK